MSCHGQPLPVLYVSKERDHALMGNFLKKKHGVLSEHIRKPETVNLYIRTDRFVKLIGDLKGMQNAYGVRICLANYVKTTGISDLDQEVAETNSVGKMTVVFRPTDSKFEDLPLDFIISPIGRVVLANPTITNQLIDSFKDVKVPLLNRIGVREREDFRETESLWTRLPSLDNVSGGLIKEMYCQEASGVRLYFGALENGDTCDGEEVGGQLTAVFVLTRTVQVGGSTYEENFDIDETGRSRMSSIRGAKLGLFSFDTLKPCPPASCPPDGRSL